ncbi:hypothetical protein TNCT_695751 [Trichonephila clavata]|uniref:Uncharacterized protein n=1 Tax=Trichonephila clavata TaxID=2740835 RepID=A0A8X6KV74_TRICU|nr:hypothetical protein TNCT_363611 [Trichonephila clavata]GFQ87785.1 hypothetical protein TNCT_695751 [Trichonephila clavata]
MDALIKYHGKIESRIPSHIRLTRNKCVSYGLIVRTPQENVLVLQRKVPYCVENFMKRLHDRKITYSEESIGPRFEEEYLYPENQLEYDRYRRGSAFEYKIDFPRGQLRAEILRKILQNRVEIFYFGTLCKGLKKKRATIHVFEIRVLWRKCSSKVRTAILTPNIIS